jgi:hypothetical protein
VKTIVYDALSLVLLVVVAVAFGYCGGVKHASQPDCPAKCCTCPKQCCQAETPDPIQQKLEKLSTDLEDVKKHAQSASWHAYAAEKACGLASRCSAAGCQPTCAQPRGVIFRPMPQPCCN